ncbi:HTH_Tnp_Tc3_2 domain-containing protein [Trichonephila clavipes]|nr:HTH_Tnp_Tc3_2 domain-containing protein [Trichonephila clavipes]
MANNPSVRRHLNAFTRGRIIGRVGGRPQCDKPEETGGRQREKSLDTTQAAGRPISRFTVARRLHGGGLLARRPVRCVPLTPAHRRRRSLWCREHRNWRDNEWGRVLFTDESRFSLSSDSHRILIWREREAAIIPRTSLKGQARRLAARTLPPVTIRELRLALQDEWAAMPQQLIDTLILSMGRRCETCLAFMEDHIPY